MYLKARTPGTASDIPVFSLCLLGKCFVPDAARGNWDTEESEDKVPARLELSL